jgi:hypothetical protein
MKRPVDGGELRDEEEIESDSEKIQIEEQPQQAHGQAAKGTADQQQLGIAAKTSKALAAEPAALGLKIQNRSDTGQKPQA